MFKFLKKIKGQSTMEYAVLIIIIIGALVSVQVYIKRGIEGRLKSVTDDIGEQFSPGNTNQFLTTNTRSVTNDTYSNGATKSTLLETELTSTKINTLIINVDLEYWGNAALGGR